MSLSDKIAIAALIVSASGFTVKGTIIYFKTKTGKIKTIFKNPYILTFLFVAIASILIAFLPWEKFHYGDAKERIVYVDSSKIKDALLRKKAASSIHDTIKILVKGNHGNKLEQKASAKKEITNSAMDKYDQESVENNGQQNQNNGANSGNIGGKNNFNGGNGQYNAPIHVGDVIREPHLDAINGLNLLNFILKQKKLANSNSTIVELCKSPQSNASIFMEELRDFLNKNGYQVKNLDCISSMKSDQQYSITVDIQDDKSIKIVVGILGN